MRIPQPTKEETEIPEQVPKFPIYDVGGSFTSDLSPIEGLMYKKDFITKEEEELILHHIYSNKWSEAIHRRQQFYGQVYFHTTHDLKQIQPVEINEYLLDLSFFENLNNRLIENGVFSRSKPPTQILVNEYVGRQGIASHFDIPTAFGDTIATISLVNPVWMTLKHEDHEKRVLLEARSLCVMRGDSRYKYTHGIGKNRWVILPNGKAIKRDAPSTRISLTVRELLPGRKQVTKDSVGWKC